MRSSYMYEKTLRWGIVGCGRISSDFVRALSNCEHPNRVHAVATSNSMERAEEFIVEYIPETQRVNVKAYGSYSELLDDPEIDVVYVGLLNHQHKQAVLSALEKGKHVLCEKPLGVNASEVREMVAKAREKKKFLMEAYWTRFFPVWRSMPQQLEEIGGAHVVLCDFGFSANAVSKTELAWGGGYLLAIGCYPVMITSLVFGGERPVRIKAVGALGDKKTDMWGSVTLEYSNNRLANLFYTGLNSTPCQASVSGPNGHIKFPERFWCPSKLVKEVNGEESQLIEFPIPGREKLSDYNYPFSCGLCYEADHVYECLKEEKLESYVMSLEESILLAEICDEIRAQLCVHFPQDCV